MREQILVLGATGSIGRQCLDILKYSFDYELVGVSLHGNIDILEKDLPYFDTVKVVAIQDEEKARLFQERHPSLKVLSGKDCNVRLIEALPKATVFNSLMGNVGLAPTLAAIKDGRDLLLSNKESIVIGSELMKEAMKGSPSHVYPVDSEHVALAKILADLRKRGVPKKDILQLVVTASGGALRDYKKEDLASVTPAQVLSHPTWAMGKKITIDSATMVNKGFEVIEASFLFDFPLEQVSAVICRESLVHALVRYRAGGEEKWLYEYSPCDMKVAIAYALSKGTLPRHRESPEDVEKVRKLHFAAIDRSFYPLFDKTIETSRRYGNVGMILYNAVDTKAIEAFLDGKMPYLSIDKALTLCMKKLEDIHEKWTIDRLEGIEDRLDKVADAIVREVL